VAADGVVAVQPTERGEPGFAFVGEGAAALQSLAFEGGVERLVQGGVDAELPTALIDCRIPAAVRDRNGPSCSRSSVFEFDDSAWTSTPGRRLPDRAILASGSAADRAQSIADGCHAPYAALWSGLIGSVLAHADKQQRHDLRQDVAWQHCLVNERAPSDLVCQLRSLITEEAYLRDLTQQITDYHGSDRTIVHGPWQAADCQQILTRWFDCGLIDCIATSWATKVRSDEVVHYEYDADWRTRATEHGQHLILAHDDAGALLSDPSSWHADGDGGGVMLCASDQADGLSFDAWFGKLAGLPEHLRGHAGRGQPFPLGRHRPWCPGCGAERYLVVMHRPT
jgi:hypothetical protein